MVPLWFRGLIYASFGVLAEVIFTGLKDFPRGQGFTQLWVIPLYFIGGIGIFEPLVWLLNPIPIVLRSIIYSISILGIEYSAGYLLYRILGFCPWAYGKTRWTISEYINLSYIPLWAAAGLMGEFVLIFILLD
jgi:hypothetical protein